MKLIKKKTIKLFLAVFIVSYFASARWKNRSIQCEGIVGYLEQSHHQWVNSAPFYLPVAHIQRGTWDSNLMSTMEWREWADKDESAERTRGRMGWSFLCLPFRTNTIVASLTSALLPCCHTSSPLCGSLLSQQPFAVNTKQKGICFTCYKHTHTIASTKHIVRNTSNRMT